jgi:hypothetical protein
VDWIAIIIVGFVAVMAASALGLFAAEAGSRQGTFRGGQGR